MSLEETIKSASAELSAAIRDLAAAVRERSAPITELIASAEAAIAEVKETGTGGEKAPETKKPTAAEKAVSEAKAAAAAAKKKEADDKAAADAAAQQTEDAGGEQQLDFQKQVYPKMVEFVNKQGKAKWELLCAEFKTEAGSAPVKGKDFQPKDYAAVLSRIAELSADDEV
jgi:hypothetical protein